VIWTAPTFNADGSLKTPAYVTAFFNGVLVQNQFELKGETLYTGKPFYKAFNGAPIKLQAHGDKSEPISSVPLGARTQLAESGAGARLNTPAHFGRFPTLPLWSTIDA